MNAKTLLALFIVIDCLILVHCNRGNELIDSADKDGYKSGKELSLKYIEGAISVLALAW